MLPGPCPGFASISPEGYDFRTDLRTETSFVSPANQIFSRSGDKITGMRSCTGKMNSLAAVVIIVQVLISFLSGDSHVS